MGPVNHSKDYTMQSNIRYRRRGELIYQAVRPPARFGPFQYKRPHHTPFFFGINRNNSRNEVCCSEMYRKTIPPAYLDCLLGQLVIGIYYLPSCKYYTNFEAIPIRVICGDLAG